MGVVNTLSQVLTDMDATPIVKQHAYKHYGVVRESSAFVTTGADDSIGSEYRFVRIPSHARVTAVLGSLDENSSSAGAGDVGVWQTTENGSAVVDTDFFASAWDFNVLGDAYNVDLVNEAGAGNLVAEQNMQLWEALGLSADPQIDYDIVLELTEAIAGGACILGLKVQYIVD